MILLRAVGYALVTMLVYLGTSLIGWGLGDLEGFFASGPRIAYAIFVALLGVGAGYQSTFAPEGFRGGRREDRSKRLQRQSVVSALIITAMYSALFFLPFADRRGLAVFSAGLGLRWIGAALAGIGFALILWSGLVLGRMYSKHVTVQEDHQLVATGLYRRIRHPRYLGALALALGVTLLYRSWVGAGMTLLLVPILVGRINDEEGVMHAAFGAEWEAYVARSWRLIPHVY